jgi:hypothetical protein
MLYYIIFAQIIFVLSLSFFILSEKKMYIINNIFNQYNIVNICLYNKNM